MSSASIALSSLPVGLRDPLLAEYGSILRNYWEGKWTSSELSGGRFCEIVYTILDGCAKGAYASAPTKPSNFVEACRKLESATGVPRSSQILIPRLLPALYEIRNNRNVGHVGGDVDPNYMDASAVVAIANWVMAELVRVFHKLSTEEAQALVDSLVDRRVPIVWRSGQTKRVLRTGFSLREEVLVLLSSSGQPASPDDLLKWTETSQKRYLTRVLRELHKQRLIEFSAEQGTVQLLPPGAVAASEIIATVP